MHLNCDIGGDVAKVTFYIIIRVFIISLAFLPILYIDYVICFSSISNLRLISCQHQCLFMQEKMMYCTSKVSYFSHIYHYHYFYYISYHRRHFGRVAEGAQAPLLFICLLFYKFKSIPQSIQNTLESTSVGKKFLVSSSINIVVQYNCMQLSCSSGEYSGQLYTGQL